MRAENKPDRALRQASFVIQERFLTHFPARSERSPSGSQLFSTAFPRGEGRDGTGPRLHGEGWARSATGAGQSCTDTPAAQAAPAPQGAPQRPGQPGTGQAVRAARVPHGAERGCGCRRCRSSSPQHTGSFVPRRPPAGPRAAPPGLCLMRPLSHRREGLPPLPHTAEQVQGTEGSFAFRANIYLKYPFHLQTNTRQWNRKYHLDGQHSSVAIGTTVEKGQKGQQQAPVRDEHCHNSPDCSNF